MVQGRLRKSEGFKALPHALAQRKQSSRHTFTPFRGTSCTKVKVVQRKVRVCDRGLVLAG
jgi:hypothetical protein